MYVPLGTRLSCLSSYISGLYVEKKVLVDFLWHFKVNIVWISLKTLCLKVLAIFASDHDYCNPHAGTHALMVGLG